MTMDWIPVTERQPEAAERYLTTYVGHYSDEPDVQTAFFNGNYWVLKENTKAILAWAPLPEPYRAESVVSE